MDKFNFSIITEPWQKCLVDEYQSLNERTAQLNESLELDGFIDKVGETQYNLLLKQKDAMLSYEKILEERMIDLKIMEVVD